jgi:hypothetical protein
MCAWIEDEEKIEALTKLMLFNEQQWLPEAWKEWIPKEEELKQMKYWVDKKELAKADKKFLQVKFAPDDQLRSKAFFWPSV